MKKQVTAIIFGIIAGILDVIPMAMQGLTWDANLAAFSMWIVVAFFIVNSDLKINPVLKGIIIAFLILLPSAVLIGWKEPAALIPIAIMTTLISAMLGWAVDKFAKD